MSKQSFIILISGRLNSGKDEVGSMLQKEVPNLNLEIVKFAGKIKETIALWLGVSLEKLEDREFKESPLGPEWTVYYRKNVIMHYDSVDKEITTGPLFNLRQEAESSSPDVPYMYDLVSSEVIAERLTPRRLFQLLGTNCGRKLIHPNIWVLTTFADYNKESNWAIPDTRFPNELEGGKRKAKETGSKLIVIRVERSLFNRTGGKYESLRQVLDQDADLYSKLTHESETSLDSYAKEGEFDYYIDNNGTLENLRNQVKNIIKWEKLNEK